MSSARRGLPLDHGRHRQRTGQPDAERLDDRAAARSSPRPMPRLRLISGRQHGERVALEGVDDGQRPQRGERVEADAVLLEDSRAAPVRRTVAGHARAARGPHPRSWSRSATRSSTSTASFAACRSGARRHRLDLPVDVEGDLEGALTDPLPAGVEQDDGHPVPLALVPSSPLPVRGSWLERELGLGRRVDASGVEVLLVGAPVGLAAGVVLARHPVMAFPVASATRRRRPPK